jgi:hypothetical protein
MNIIVNITGLTLNLSNKKEEKDMLKVKKNRSDYDKKYYQKNKEIIKKLSKKYYFKNKKRCLLWAKKWREKNKERYKKVKKEYYQNNKEKVDLSNKIWKEKNKEKYKKNAKKYYQKNKTIIIKNNTKRKKIRLKTDLNFKLITNLRRRILHALKGNSKSNKTITLLGIPNIEFLWNHLEKSFKPGMTRKNHGKWHIDHIKPCASFDLTKPSEQRECFHYTNLQPLWASENLSKGNRIS